MSFVDKMKSGFEKAKEGVTDFAETTKIKHEIGKLTDHRSELLAEIGKQVHALHAHGHGIAEVEAQCKAIDDIDAEIKKKGEEIARINTENGTPTSTAPNQAAV